MTAFERVAQERLSRLTVREKIGQLVQANLGDMPLEEGRIPDAVLQEKLDLRSVGTVCISPRDSHAETRQKIASVQAYLREKTPHGIPALVVAETLHGLLSPGATIFPQAIALGSTWNPDLTRSIGEAIGREASALSIHQALAPVLDLCRDPRFGRIEECYGECPTLVKTLGLAYIQGLQGEDPAKGLGAEKILATPKHFAGYSTPANGLNLSPTLLGERDFRSLHLIPFETAVKQGKVKSVMPAYNCVDGIPCHANEWLLTTVLRGEYGFAGYVYSDWGGVSMNHNTHHVAEDFAAAALLALKAGVDLDAPAGHGFRHLEAQVESGAVDESLIDQAVLRVLGVKAMAGLFGEGALRPEGDIHCDAHIALSHRAAEESVILLENQDDLLPLKTDRLRSLAVIGPNSDQVQFGDYCWSKSNQHGVSILKGIRELVGDEVRIHHAQGCGLVDLSEDKFPAAVEAASKSDVAVVVIGDTSSINGGIGWEDKSIPALGTVGETFDVSDPVAPGVQLELVQAIHATGTPTIVIMLNGRPYSVPWIKKHIPGVILAFYPGERQGSAVADILFGRVNPSGRLPVSIAQSAGHIPTVYDHKATGRGCYNKPGSPEEPGRDYIFSSPHPLWPFGHGLSYTRFEYLGLSLDKRRIQPDGTLSLQVEVKNAGSVPGKEVVQVYVNDKVSSTTTPAKRLVAFAKIDLAAGESAQVPFTIDASELGLWDPQMAYVVEPGEFDLLIGSSAEHIRLQDAFKVTPA